MQVLFTKRSLIDFKYIHEALCNQEHFSAKSLIHNLYNVHCKSTPHESHLMTSKWIIYTQTCDELLQDNISELYQEWVLPDDDSTQSNYLKVINVIDISKANTSSEFLEQLGCILRKEFCMDKKRLVMIIADRNIVTVAQLSFVKRSVSSMTHSLSFETTPLIVLLQHTKYTENGSHCVDCCLPMDCWDQYYTDSFGFANNKVKDKSGSDSPNKNTQSTTPTTTPNNAVDFVINQKYSITSSSVRHCLSTAFGIFEPLYEVVTNNTLRYNMITKIYKFGLIVIGESIDALEPQMKKSKSFYTFKKPEKSAKWLMAFFISRLFLVDELLNLSLTYNIFNLLNNGDHRLGIFDQSCDILKRSHCCKEFMYHTLFLLCSDYGLESLANMLPTDNSKVNVIEDKYALFVTHILRDLIESYSKHKPMSFITRPVVLNLNMSFVPGLPLYSILKTTLHRIYDAISSSHPSIGEREIFQRVKLVINERPQLANALKYIEDYSEIYALFIKDHIRDLHFIRDITTWEVDLLVDVLQKCNSPNILQ